MKFLFILTALSTSFGLFSQVYVSVQDIGVINRQTEETKDGLVFTHETEAGILPNEKCIFASDELTAKSQLAFTLYLSNIPYKKKFAETKNITISVAYNSLDSTVSAIEKISYDAGQLLPNQTANMRILLSSKNFKPGIYEIRYGFNGAVAGKFYYYINRETMAQKNSAPGTEELDKPCSFPGGESEMLRFIQTHVEYPEICRELGVQGTVYFQFDVDENGNLCNFDIMKSVDSILDNEVLRIVLKMPKWEPAIKDGKAIRSRFSFPVKFSIA